jgi:hypothetical protein
MLSAGSHEAPSGLAGMHLSDSQIVTGGRQHRSRCCDTGAADAVLTRFLGDDTRASATLWQGAKHGLGSTADWLDPDLPVSA